jgi:uncharacterized protein DUF6282
MRIRPHNRSRWWIKAALRVLMLVGASAWLGVGLSADPAQAGAGAPQDRGAGGGAQGQAAGAGQGRGAGRGAAAAVVSGDPILVGTIDLHAHQGPDSRARSIDFLDAARYAKLRGMRGLVFKSHLDPTAIQAYIARKEVPGFEAWGTIDLNHSVGGMNPAAVEHFVQVSMPGAPPEGYGRVVMMASDDAALQLQVSNSSAPPVYVVRNGAVVPEAKTIIGLIKKYNLSMTTGHNSGQEAILLIKEAIAQGIPPTRLGVTHANINPPGLTVEEMQEVARLGAFVEMCTQSQRAFSPEAQKALDARNDRIADLIKKVGPNNVIIETDLGQGNNEYHPDGLAAFVRAMRARGISAQDTDRMTKENPAKFLGIPVLPATTSSTQ